MGKAKDARLPWESEKRPKRIVRYRAYLHIAKADVELTSGLHRTAKQAVAEVIAILTQSEVLTTHEVPVKAKRTSTTTYEEVGSDG